MPDAYSEFFMLPHLTKMSASMNKLLLLSALFLFGCAEEEVYKQQFQRIPGANCLLAEFVDDTREPKRTIQLQFFNGYKTGDVFYNLIEDHLYKLRCLSHENIPNSGTGSTTSGTGNTTY